VVALFACSLLFTSDTITWKHDYRAASAYLAANARPADTAVFLGTDNSVSRLYWHGAPPLTSLNALDPRVGTALRSGDLYWLIGYEHRVDPTSMPSRWQFVADFNGLLLFKEPAPLQAGSDAAIAQGMTDAAQALAEAGRTDPVLAQVSRSLIGNALQASGDLNAAAQAYHDAGTLYPIGGEYRLTSEGFAQRGEYEQAWLDAVMAKAMQPERVDVHLWMADLLARTGQADLAEAERTVANSLQSLSSGAVQRSP
jgi:hypothetical protein